MREVDTVEMSVYGSQREWEKLMPEPDIVGQKRVYCLPHHAPILYDLRESGEFSRDRDIYLALSYTCHRSDQPRRVVDGNGDIVRPYVKDSGSGGARLKWVKKMLFLIDFDSEDSWGSISGWSLDMSRACMVDRFLFVEGRMDSINAMVRQYVVK